MKKDIEWAKNRIKNTLKFEALNDREIGFKVAMGEALEILNQLDEPEVLSQEWIDRHTDKFVGNEGFRFVNTNDLQNLLVPKQELPVIPQFVAEWIEEVKPDNSLRVVFEYIAQRKSDNHDDELAFWVEEGNSETFARAWLDGYEIEKEPKYEKVLRVGEMFFRGGGYKDDVFVLELSGSRNAHVFVDEGEATNIQSSIGGQLEELEQ